MVSLYKPAVRTIVVRFFKIAILVAAFFLLYLFIDSSDLDRIATQLAQIGWRFAIILVPVFLGQLLATAAWRRCFLERPSFSLFKLFTIRLMGESLTQINPTNFLAGETMKAMLLNRDGIGYRQSIVALTTARIIMLLSSTTVILFGLSAGFARSGTFLAYLAPLLAIALAGVVALFLVLLQKGMPVFSLPFLFLRRAGRGRRFVGLERKLRKIDDDLALFYRERRADFTRAYFLSLLHWFGGATELYLVLSFLGVEVGFLSCLAMEVGVICFRAMGAFVPGQIGVEEYANRLMLSLIGVPGADLWISVSIVRRARQLFWIGMGTLFFSLVMLRRRVKKAPLSPEEYESPLHYA